MKGATRGSGGTFHSLEKSKNNVVEFGAVSLKAPHLSRETAGVDGEETGAEISVETSLVQRSECEVNQRQRDPFVRQLLANGKESLMSFLAREKMSRSVPVQDD